MLTLYSAFISISTNQDYIYERTGWTFVLLWDSRNGSDGQTIPALSIPLGHTKGVDSKGTLPKDAAIEPNGALKLPSQGTDQDLFDNTLHVTLIRERNRSVHIALQCPLQD